MKITVIPLKSSGDGDGRETRFRCDSNRCSVRSIPTKGDCKEPPGNWYSSEDGKTHYCPDCVVIIGGGLYDAKKEKELEDEAIAESDGYPTQVWD